MQEDVHANAILIPDDSRDPVVEVYVNLDDGGLRSLMNHLAGDPEELALAGRSDAVAFFNEAAQAEDQPRNVRATRLLAHSLPPGGHIAGPLVICGQQADGGLTALPDNTTLAGIERELLILAAQEGAA